MHTRNFCVTVVIIAAWVIHTATVVLSAPITPVLHTLQDESKRAKQAQCRSSIVYTGNDVVGASDKREAQAGDECVQKQRVVASGELQPYTAMLALEGHGTAALQELSCSRSLGCGVAALEPLRQDGKEQWPILAPGLTVTDTDRVGAAFTSIRSKALMYADGEDFTKLTLDREVFTQLGSALSISVAGDGAGTFPWDRLFNLGPLLLLFLEKLLGRL